jgi:hypothetical protein
MVKHNKARIHPELSHINIIKWWLTGLLLFLPFQRKIVKGMVLWSRELSSFISYLDEITIIVLLPLSMYKFYKSREFPDRLYLILLLPVFMFCISGLISGMVNGNSVFVTILGVFDYIKNFLVIFIFAAFFRDFGEFKKFFRLLMIVAVFLGVIALIQEVRELVYRYILGNDVVDTGFYFSSWRLGIYRAPSLMHNANIFGLYCLLMLTVYLCMSQNFKIPVIIPLLAGVFMSVSRLVYMGFLFLCGLQLLKGRKWFLALLVPVLVLLLIMFFYHEFNISKFMNIDKQVFESNTGFVNYKIDAKKTAMNIWKDHFLLGAGPGMFGGVVSIKYKSDVYEQYNLSRDTKQLIFEVGSIDQFWPQALAEMGIIGSAAFVSILISLVIILLILRIWATSDEVGGLFTGLVVITILIFIYSLYTGLNITSILFTYSAFVGMGVGSENPYYK